MTEEPIVFRICNICGNIIESGKPAYNLTSLGYGYDKDGNEKWSCLACKKGKKYRKKASNASE